MLRGISGHAAGDDGVVNENVASLHVRPARHRSEDVVGVGDFTMLVSVAGRPGAVRVFTDAESDEAPHYAVETGGKIVPLPLLDRVH